MASTLAQYEALFLIVTLVVLYFWRGLFLKWEKSAKASPGSTKKTLLLSLHYYTPMYLTFGFLLYTAARNAWTEMRATHFLDPAALEERFSAAVFAENENEVSLANCQWLRWLSLSAPFFVLATVGVSIWHTIHHVTEVKKREVSICDRVLHDRAIQIIALPVVYGLMSFNSVTRMWQVLLNSDSVNAVAGVMNGGFTAKKDLLEELYEVNFMVADLYEAWALFQFAELALKVIETQFHKEERMLEHVLIDMKDKLGNSELYEDANLVLKSNKELITSVDSLTVQGIYAFIATCLIQSVFSLLLTTSELTGTTPEQYADKLPSIRASAHMFFLGMGAISSSAAIGNILTIETCHHEKLEHFKPFLKFWGTKVLVSLAFLQTILLMFVPGLNTMSTTKQNLFYSSMLCIECFLVSVLSVFSWKADEEWYHEIEDEETSWVEEDKRDALKAKLLESKQAA